MAYDAIEPFGDTRANLHAGMIAATMANAWSAAGSKTVSPMDFMVDTTPKEEPTQSMKDQKETCALIASALGYKPKE